MRSTKFQQEPEQVKMETLPERMERLIREEGELKIKEIELRKRLSESGQQDRVAILKSGGSLHPLVDAEDLLARLAQIEVDRLDYGAAIRSLQLEADVAKNLEARRKREKQRPEYEKAIRAYILKIREITPVMETVRQFDEFRVAPLVLPGVFGLQNLEQQETIFGDKLRRRGINPADVGIIIPDPYVPPVQELSPERKKNMRERYPESTLASDMPKAGHFI